MFISSDSLAKASTSPIKSGAPTNAPPSYAEPQASSALPNEKPAVSTAQLKQQIEQLNRFVAGRNAQIEFQVDESSARVITKIVDSKTKEVIRQIPNEEVLRISAAISSALNQEAAPVLISAVA